MEEITGSRCCLEVLGSIRRGTQTKGACIYWGPPVYTYPSSAHSCTRLAENCMHLGSTLLQIEQHKGLKHFLFLSGHWEIQMASWPPALLMLSILTRMPQTRSPHPPLCTALRVPGFLSQTPSSFAPAAGQFLSLTHRHQQLRWHLLPCHQPHPCLCAWALHNLQSYPPPIQLGSTGHRDVVIPPSPSSLLSQIAESQMFVSKKLLSKQS